MWKNEWYCRWCGSTYRPKKCTDRDGFCCTKHKQAHHRAYTKYVTGLLDLNDKKRSGRTGVTPKCRKR